MATENSNVIKAISIYGANEWQEPTPIGVDAENVFMNVDGEQKTLADFSENIVSNNFLSKEGNQTLTGSFTTTGNLIANGEAQLNGGATIKTSGTGGVVIKSGVDNSSLGINHADSLTIVTPYEPVYFGERNMYSIPVGSIHSKTFQQEYQWYRNKHGVWPVFKANVYFPICGISNSACDSGIYLVTATIHLRSKSLINMPVTAYISPVNDLETEIKDGTTTIEVSDRDSKAFSSTAWRNAQNDLLKGISTTKNGTIYSAFHSQRTVLGSTRNTVTQISLSTIYYFSTKQENRDFYLVLQNNNDTNYGYLTNFIATQEETDNGTGNPINANITVLKLF